MDSALRSVRGLVSKKKRRFQQDGFDLDLTYVTPRIIAMGFPSSGAESMYRNPADEVLRFFEFRHRGRYKFYNLCSERAYDAEMFNGRVERFPFNDHNPCPLGMIKRFCSSVEEWLNKHPDNVAAIHCKAGKGRTGLMICCYLMFSKTCATASEALTYFGEARTANGKGVTIPSQKRWVFYYSHILQHGPPAKISTFQITRIRFVTVPNVKRSGGCAPFFCVYVDNNLVYDYRKHHKVQEAKISDPYFDLDFIGDNVYVNQNVRVQFYHYDAVQTVKMFQFWFHTAYVWNNFLLLRKGVLDGALKDKKHKIYAEDFAIEMYLHEVGDVTIKMAKPATSGEGEGAAEDHGLPDDVLPEDDTDTEDEDAEGKVDPDD